MRLLLALAILVLSPSLAFAHADASHAAGFVHGFEHPIGGLDHVLGGRALWLVPLSFVAMMVVGFGLGIAQVDVPFVEFGIALSSIVIGAAAAMGRPMPVAGAMALVGMFAIFHGHAHGAEMPADASGLSYAAGFIAATSLLHLAGLAGTFGAAKLVGKYGRIIAQIAGGAFALAGLGALGGWL